MTHSKLENFFLCFIMLLHIFLFGCNDQNIHSSFIQHKIVLSSYNALSLECVIAGFIK